ncbi:MAG: hypothetical protein JXD23_15720 [Spirochaetales bacterium]|nr:hypothetical protein [Spirochaetales bacterium]
MPLQEKKPFISLPLKIVLTSDGINFFIKHKKNLQRFKMADNVEEYGISLDNFSPQSIQRMILVNYISKLELSRAEFVSKRHEIMDCSKLIVYGILYKQLDDAVFKKVISSALIKQWNRTAPKSIIDERTKINESYLEGIITKDPGIIQSVKREILGTLFDQIKLDNNLEADEKAIKLYTLEKYMNNLRPFTWFILTKFRGTQEYFLLVSQIRELLKEYLEKAKIAEYLSLMIMELAINAENANLQGYIKRTYKGTIDPNEVVVNINLRNRILKEIEQLNECIYLSWQVGGSKSGAIGMMNKLNITIYNRESEYRELKQSVENKKILDLKEKSLTDFYRGIPEAEVNTELGLYYLSYLSEACDKVNVRFESLVNQLRNSDLTIIMLKLSF